MANEIIVNDQADKVVSYKKLSSSEQKQVSTIADTIDITDSSAVIQYGVNIQSEISEFSDSVLSRVKSNESGYVGEVLSELMVKVKAVKVDDIARQQYTVRKIHQKSQNKFNKFMSRYQKLGTQIDTIVDSLEDAKAGLLSDIALLDTLHEKNLVFMKDLEYYIIAGQMKLDALRETTLPELQAKAKASGDQADAQNYNDMKQLAERFEKKIHDLKLSRTITIQTAPQLRLIQNNDQVLVEKIQSSILNTVPLWKNQIVIAISLYRQLTALQLQKEVSDTTNELLLKNAELLKENAIGARDRSGARYCGYRNLAAGQRRPYRNHRRNIRIQKEGRAKRAEAEKELIAMEKALKDKLTAPPA